MTIQVGYKLLCSVVLFCLTLGLGKSAIIKHPESQLSTYPYENHTCFKCPAGTLVSKHCEKDYSKSDCSPCGHGFFQSTLTGAMRCKECDPVCHDVNMIVETECNATNNLKCRCKEGYVLYQDAFTETYSCDRQWPVTPQHRGGPSTPRTDGEPTTRTATTVKHIEGTTTQVYQAPCKEGQFYNHAQCRPCSSCIVLGRNQLLPCTQFEDAVCQQPQPDTGSPNVPVIIGVSVGLFLLVVLCIFVALLVWKLSKRRKGREGHSTTVLATRHGDKRVVFSIRENGDEKTLEPLLEEEFEGGPCTAQASVQRSLSNQSTFSAMSKCPEPTDRNAWTREVFTILSQQLITNWRSFMRNLPGPEEWSSDVEGICNRVQIEFKDMGLQEQIYQALLRWEQHRGEDIQVEDILRSLFKIGECDHIMQKVKQCCRRLNKTERKRLRSESSVSSIGEL